ncbi:helix-turn-helix domain-containing protein [Flavobacterium psychrophilum]|uniref:Helix-turn-helix domain-containing protein n=1 Tax=Flavobacterium psychrophilum TaxID=96345 RepID=A0A7U2R919_FLAPS|nr:helix-turn-helix domain-containing protein [Flavobacterium psychrophilum]QRE03545.1 helix-turn-helix domain-containing protein [Flavobacterium psychrophilum]
MEITFTAKLSKEQMLELAQQVAEINHSNNQEKIATYEATKNYTCKQVAFLTNLSKATVQRHCEKGIIEASKTGKSWIITTQSLNKYIGKK